MIVRRVGILSLGKVLGSIYAIFGLLAGLFFALISLLGAAAHAQRDGFMPFAGLGVAAIIVFPFIYGIAGFISGVIMAMFYNIVAAIVGGVKVDFERPATPYEP